MRYFYSVYPEKGGKGRFVMKKAFLFTLCAFSGVLALLLASCPGAWEGIDNMAEVRIGAAGGNGRTALPNAEERDAATVKVRFTSPGKAAIEKEFGALGGTVRLEAGTWRLESKSYNSDQRLRGMADEEVELKPGSGHTIELETCVGIQNETDLIAALGSEGLPGIGKDDRPGKPEILVLENDITLTKSAEVSGGWGYIIIAEPGTTRTIKRNLETANVFILNDADLTLGREGESGKLIVDENNLNRNAFVEAGGALHIAGNTTFINDENTPPPVTVHFHLNGGTSSDIPPVRVPAGNCVDMPSPNPTSSGYNFTGWYSDAGGTNRYDFNAPVTRDLHLYAGWTTDLCTVKIGENIHGALALASAFSTATAGTSDNPAVITLYANTNVDSEILIGDGSVIILTSITDCEISKGSSNGSLFNVNNPNAKLTVTGHVTLKGKTGNNLPLVNVASGEFILDGNAKITGNNNSSSGGGVLVVGASSTFTMKGGSITDNTAGSSGGGVYVGSNGTFNMEGGSISGNSASKGGGVSVYSEHVTMSGGSINSNTATSYGGGVSVEENSGKFTLKGGSIAGNTALSSGGGVYVTLGEFIIEGGAISGNNASGASDGGGGIYINKGTVTMSGGNIVGNTAVNDGGGIRIDISPGSLTMTGGSITGNTAQGTTNGGGGVYMGANTSFTMSDTASITGNTAVNLGGGVYLQGGTFALTGNNTEMVKENHASNSNNVKKYSGTITINGNPGAEW
jgi:uncharacterized repeat protein (TIGR02543 family)